jgi:hypothetical protein
MILQEFDCERDIPFWRVVGVESAWSVPENLGKRDTVRPDTALAMG